MIPTILDDDIWFPHPEATTGDGLLAIGGDLSLPRLLLAYRHGIFPWFNPGEPPLWWCPDPRFVLFPQELKVSKSMKQLLKKQAFHFSINKAFTEVIHNCKEVIRKDQPGTWITDEIEDAYTALHHEGHALSAEAWAGDTLVGGLYGVKMGKVFFGESMFSHASNASKYAFIKLMQQLQQEGVRLIDCQVYTEHLESLGARMIPRKDFLSLLDEYIV